MQYPPADLRGILQNLFTDFKRLSRKWWKFAKDQIKKPQLGHTDLIRTYIQSLKNGHVPPVTGEDGRNAVRLLECIEESLENGKSIKYYAL
jgi:predicted dehydrogenase